MLSTAQARLAVHYWRRLMHVHVSRKSVRAAAAPYTVSVLVVDSLVSLGWPGLSALPPRGDARTVRERESESERVRE